MSCEVSVAQSGIADSLGENSKGKCKFILQQLKWRGDREFKHFKVFTSAVFEALELLQWRKAAHTSFNQSQQSSTCSILPQGEKPI